jgi:site-specific DNA-methyltransferase (adenine-specific)
MTPAYRDDWITLYQGDCREVLPALDLRADLVEADPPYGITKLEWDEVVEGWQAACLDAARDGAGLWLWGSLDSTVETWPAMLAAGWKRARGVDAVWRKSASRAKLARASRPNYHGDRFNSVHEIVSFWHKGDRRDLYTACPRQRVGTTDHGRVRTRAARRKAHSNHQGAQKPLGDYVDDGMRYLESVLDVDKDPNKSAIHGTQKPVTVYRHLVEFGCPPGGLVVVPFVGSGASLMAARATGRRAVGAEVDPEQIAKTVDRLRQQEIAAA